MSEDIEIGHIRLSKRQDMSDEEVGKFWDRPLLMGMVRMSVGKDGDDEHSEIVIPLWNIVIIFQHYTGEGSVVHLKNPMTHGHNGHGGCMLFVNEGVDEITRRINDLLIDRSMSEILSRRVA